MTESIIEIVKIILPAVIVLYAVYLVVKAFLNKQFEHNFIQNKIESTRITLPLRLQAYERLCILLERSSPNALLMRANNPEMNVAELHFVMLTELRQELAHNLSQQLYVSDPSWALVKAAIEDVIAIINACAKGIDPSAPSLELAKRIMEYQMALDNDPVSPALANLKSEAKTLM